MSFPKPEMSAVLVVVTDIVFQQPSQMLLVHDDHVIQQVSPYASNPALSDAVLPRTSKSGPGRVRLRSV